MNNEFGIRFNGAYRSGDGPFDDNEVEHGLPTIALDYRGDRVRASVDVGHQNSNLDGVTNLLSPLTFSPLPAPPDAGKNFLPSWNYTDTENLFWIAQGEVDLAENVTAYASIGGMNSKNRYALAYPLINDTAGNWIGYGYGGASETETRAAQAGLRGWVHTGPIKHSLNLNVSQAEQEEASSDAYIDFIGSWNIYSPANIPNPNLDVDAGPAFSTQSKRASVGISDTLSLLDEQIQFTAGVRRQKVESSSPTSSYEEYAWSPAYALVIKPWANVSLYANYIEGLQEGIVVGSGFSNSGQIFPPYHSKQYEAGVKIDWGRITSMVSAFEISRPNTIRIPTSPPTLALDGEQVNRGIEINVFGELTKGTRILGGITFFDARQAKTQGGTNDGKKVTDIPDFNFVLGAEYDLPMVPGVTLTGRVNRVDETYLDPGNVITVPAWTRLDLGARYTFVAPWNDKPATLRLNVENVLDNDYWVNRGGAYSIAPPRTYLVSLTSNF